MIARSARRISQPDSRCVPNTNAVLNKKNVVALPRLPLPQLQPWLFSTKTGSTRPYHLRSFIRATHCREYPSRPESERPVGA